MSVLTQVCVGGVVPVIVIDDLDRAPELGEALKDGGLPVAEVTLRTDDALAALTVLARDSDLLVGAGTVVRADQVDAAHDAGARFVVTPGFSRPVVERCRELDMPVVPGVATATEVIAAVDSGFELLKFFPAEASGGLLMLRALHSPFPQVRFIPTGGVSAANAGAYLTLPGVAAVGGSWMATPELVRAGDFESIARLAKEAVRIAREARL
jgi:2-dehydro-3-deoxyphosphogluconate aldolase/(4S)-4-hydroxy-2-oxoglutarate aldolase